MKRAKSNLSIKTRNARRIAEIRKKWSPEQLQIVRQKRAAQKAAKRAAETIEETEARRRRNARLRKERRSQRQSKEKLLRVNAVLEAINPKQNNKKKKENKSVCTVKEIELVENAERQVALGQIEVEKLTKQMNKKTAGINKNSKYCAEHNGNVLAELETNEHIRAQAFQEEHSNINDVST